jgi:hypothetical protein
VSGATTAPGDASPPPPRAAPGSAAQLEKGLLDGFSWHGRYLTARVNPGYAPFWTGSYHFTYLYAIERCGDLASRELIGERTWFTEGAEILMAAQNDDGAMVDRTCMNPQDVLGTAFALLFLTRAHKPVSGTAQRD